MPIIDRIAEFQADMTAWRRDLHAHPETAFEEHRTSDFVAAKLEGFGIAVHRGLAEPSQLPFRTNVPGRLWWEHALAD